MTTKDVLAKGLADKVGMQGSIVKHEKENGDKVSFVGEIIDHQSGIEYILGILTSEKHGCLKSLNEIEAVGHRVVHGGEKFNSSVLINPDVVKAMVECIDLAPLHNPPNLNGIYAITSLMPETPQVGVFDTAFHQTMPPVAYMYATPYSLYKKYGIRRYGFHGTSHRYVSAKACETLGVDYNTQKIITCHLGNGGSMAAIKNGKSMDTTMGLTPVEGLIMGTRCGDVDAGVLTYIMDKEEISYESVSTLINKHSGLLGISGVSSDMRDIEIEAWDNKNERAQLSLDMYAYRIRKYIGSYAAAMGGVDMLIFTGGVGENGWEMRESICQGLDFLGLEFDKDKNFKVRGKFTVLSKDSSKAKILVVPTNEELMIAEDTVEILEKKK